jgi:hypothetical protein
MSIGHEQESSHGVLGMDTKVTSDLETFSDHGHGRRLGIPSYGCWNGRLFCCTNE